MRSIAALAVSAALALGIVALVPAGRAGAAPEPAPASPERIESLERQVKLLQDEVAYLLGREAALTKAALSADPAAKALFAGIEESRKEGFEAAAIPAPARAVLLRALDGLARDLSSAVPTPTAQEATLARELANRRRALANEPR